MPLDGFASILVAVALPGNPARGPFHLLKCLTPASCRRGAAAV